MPNRALTVLAVVFADYKITKAELKIIQCLLFGYSNAAIASHLKLKEGTVKVALNSVYKKVGVRSRAEFITKFHSQFEAENCKSLMGPKIEQLETELSIYKTRSRTVEQIKAAFPQFLLLIGVAEGTTLASQMLQALLIALQL